MSMMLDAILRMPPDCWDGGVMDVMQRHATYVEAADRIEALEAALDNAGALSDWINRARSVITDLMLAYERRIRSDCTSAEQIAARPWTCSEYIMAERLLADQPKAVVMLTIVPTAAIKHSEGSQF